MTYALNPEQASRLRVGIIGAGKVGPVLGATLRACQHNIIGINARSDESKERAETLLPGVPHTSEEEILAHSDLVIYAVPDDVLPHLIEKHAQERRFKTGQLVLHPSGKFGTNILAPIRPAGAVPLAVHPITSFTGTTLDIDRLKETPFGITADVPMLPISQALVYELGGQPYTIAEADRPLYHASIAHAANHFMTLIGQASQTLHHIGIENPSEILGPVLRASLDNALENGEKALTGPVARGDSGTIAGHAQALLEYDEDIAATYRDMALATAKRARSQGLINHKQYTALLQVYSHHFFEIDPDYEDLDHPNSAGSSPQNPPSQDGGP